MIYHPSNEEIELDLSEINLNYKIESRTSLDSNPFSNLEIIKFKSVKKEYVLKSIHPILKTEVIIHTLVKDDSLNAAPVLHSKIDHKKQNYYILMDKIQFEPLYLIPPLESVKLYHSLAEKLANFHLKNNNTKFLKKLKINEYGYANYNAIISSLGNRVEKLAKTVADENLLGTTLVESLNSKLPSISTILEPVQSTKLTLVHGDFDTGNLIVKNDQIFAIDFGLAHIDMPVLDISHLLSATQMSIKIRRDIFETYFSIAGKLFPSSLSIQDVRNAGNVMHMLFFLNWYLTAIEENIVPYNYFAEQIHNRVKYITELFKTYRSK